jgi:hypothetical protein
VEPGGHIGVSGERGVGKQWFNPKAFALPQAGTFGNAGLGIIRGPRFQSFDASLFKRFRVTERVRSEFRFEAFNFLNNPLLADPVTNPRSGGLGFITSKTLISS